MKKLTKKEYENKLLKYRIKRIKCYGYELLLLLIGLFLFQIISIDNNITTYTIIILIAIRVIVVIHWIVESLFLYNDSSQIFEIETGFKKSKK